MNLPDLSRPDGSASPVSPSHAVSAASEGGLYRLMMESVEDLAIFTLDDDGRITTWNKGAELLFGFTVDEVLGRDASFLFTPEDCGEGIPSREIRTALNTGSAEDERWHVRKDGGRFWADGTMFSLHDALGRVHGFLKIIRDGTELRDLRLAVRRHEEEIIRLRATIHRLRKQSAASARTVRHAS